MVETKPKKPKFKYTRELVRIAVDDGMTQKQIGDLCRVEQSIVSGWLNGKTRAFEQQIVELKKRYGNRLNRTTSRVYLTLREASLVASRWQDTARARALLALHEKERLLEAQINARQEEMWRQEEENEQEQEEHTHARVLLHRTQAQPTEEEGKVKREIELEREELQQTIRPAAWLSIADLIKADQGNFVAVLKQEREHLTQVEGPIVLRYTFVTHKIERRRDTYELEREPVARWIVHHQPNGKFVLVQQKRRLLEGQSLYHWEQIVLKLSQDKFGSRSSEANDFMKRATAEEHIECADDSARWLSFIHGPVDAASLLSHSDAYFQDPTTFHGPHDERTLPFLMRKMLVEHGHDVQGLVRISDAE